MSDEPRLHVDEKFRYPPECAELVARVRELEGENTTLKRRLVEARRLKREWQKRYREASGGGT